MMMMMGFLFFTPSKLFSMQGKKPGPKGLVVQGGSGAYAMRPLSDVMVDSVGCLFKEECFAHRSREFVFFGKT